jgi:hypothetical protein
MEKSKENTKEVKEKKEERHYPPSYYEYRKKNPTISIKLTKQTRDALDKVRGKIGYSEFLKSLVAPDGVFVRFERQRAQLAYERAALEKERKELTKTEHFTIPCPSCGEPLDFDSRDEEFWNETVKPQLEKAFSGFNHEGDPEVPRKPKY